MPNRDDEVLKTIGCLVSPAVVGLWMAVMCVLRGWALQRMWLWFILPAFGVAVPSMGVCVGLNLIAAFLNGRKSSGKSEDGVMLDLFKSFADGALSCLFVVGLGWVVSRWV